MLLGSRDSGRYQNLSSQIYIFKDYYSHHQRHDHVKQTKLSYAPEFVRKVFIFLSYLRLDHVDTYSISTQASLDIRLCQIN